MGVIHGGWCVGCCWALMAALFALGVMSLGWMAFIAALIALEKPIPWRRIRRPGPPRPCSSLLVAVLAVPDSLPGFVVPGGSGGGGASMMDQMHGGGSMGSMH